MTVSAKRSSYLLNNVPDDIWDALRNDAASREVPKRFTSENGRTFPHRRTERTGTSINNVFGEILALRYGLEFTASNRATFDQEPEGRSLFLRMPDNIHGAVKREARKSSQRYVLLLAAAEYYGLELLVEPPARKKHGRPRGRQKAKR